MFEKKDIIHIATEVVILSGITFYFCSKNKKLSAHIEELSKRLEEQEDIIQKHEKLITQLLQKVNNYQSFTNVQPSQKYQNTNVYSNQNIKADEVLKKPVSTTRTKNFMSSTAKMSSVKASPVKVTFKNEEEKPITESDSDDESALDQEIAEELEELENSSSTAVSIDNDEDGLKKRI